MFWRRRPEESLKPRVTQLEDDQAALMRRVRDLQDLIEELDSAHRRLRGVIYARKLHKPPADETPVPSANPATMTREELKRHLTLSNRFTPGRPPVHNE